MEKSVLDELNVQLPGRLLTVEIVVLLLLHRDPRAHDLLQIVSERLNELETHLVSEGAHGDYELGVFGAARATLDQFTRDLPRD